MLEREEVSRNLHNATVASGSGMDMWLPPEIIAELCRVYLAWLDAPVTDITDCNNPKRQLPNNPWGITWDDFPTIRARIVPEEPQP